jgi:hypothetical protein
LLILTSISGCLAFIYPEILRYDTRHTTQFFDAQIRESGGSTVVLYTIRTILDSLLTYHLPAEIALKSIDCPTKGEIEQQYIERIHTIDREVAARGGGGLVAKLFHAVSHWARGGVGVSMKGFWWQNYFMRY